MLTGLLPSFGTFSLAEPWLLAFLAMLPLLWWLLRLVPPAPKKILFPAVMLLQGLVGREESPARSPWWLLLLRLAIALLLIFAFARPVFDPLPPAQNHGALLIAIDNDWAAARDWPERRAMLTDIVTRAAHDGRDVMLLPTTAAADDTVSLQGPMAAEQALTMLDHIVPQPWNAALDQAVTVLQKAAPASDAVWIASGIGAIDASPFYDALQKIAPTRIYGTAAPIYTLIPPGCCDQEPHLTIQRAVTDDAATTGVNAVAKDGNILAHWPVVFSAGSPRALVSLQDVPPALRNQIARFDMDAPRTAATTALLDGAWDHRAVGITGDAAELDRHSLLSEIYYIDRALKPYADIHIDMLDALLKEKLAVIVMTDSGAIDPDTLPALAKWVKQGGILVRFGGEHLASARADGDDLLPVPLRAGGRSLDGALTWGAPQKLQAFPANSPFHALAVPDDVTVTRQILAEPSADLAGKSWAMLQDGTPVVTAKNIGNGVSILFHIPARSGWSDLPISGLFVDMLHKIVSLSTGTHQADEHALLRPLSILDAYGEQHAPAANVQPIDGDALDGLRISPQHPPGLYGSDTDPVALNLGAMIGQPQALRSLPLQNYTVAQHTVEARPYLLLAAFLLLLVDGLVSLRLRGFLKLAVLALALFSVTPAEAATDAKLGVELTGKPYLAYVQTGDSTLDRTSELGLRGLAVMLQNRTSLDEVGVAKIDPDRDDLAFFPVIYWPISAAQRPLSPDGAHRVTHYLKHGGIILFDAADNTVMAPDFLRRILAGVDVPPLVKLPEHHLLKRSFYRLDRLPGRFADNDVWVEPDESSTYDGVASVVYGSNGWAAAWAMDANGSPLYPCTPGGEQQREYAYRFGVNLVIYALTGTYKDDQSQTAKLLQEMGR